MAIEAAVIVKAGSTKVEVAVITVWFKVSAGFGVGWDEGVSVNFSTRQAERVSVNNMRKQMHLIMALIGRGLLA